MKNSFALLVLMTFVFQTNVCFGEEDLNIDPLSNVNISKEELAKSMELLRKENKISEADFQKANKELMGMNDVQISALTQTAVGMIRKNPDKAVDLSKADKVDHKEVQKQIDSLSSPQD